MVFLAQKKIRVIFRAKEQELCEVFRHYQDTKLDFNEHIRRSPKKNVDSMNSLNRLMTNIKRANSAQDGFLVGKIPHYHTAYHYVVSFERFPILKKNIYLDQFVNGPNPGLINNISVPSNSKISIIFEPPNNTKNINKLCLRCEVLHLLTKRI